MKKTYEKPVFIRRERLSCVTAIVVISGKSG
ncbi:MAG: putative RiPP precursor [Mesorhizobium sp.]|nr:putative RiPP precursor [Mesorhizobium sp.]MBN9216490.1 putative RiPP precursor [Mesorhizobium sp.]